jgi:hypothetical protein
MATEWIDLASWILAGLKANATVTAAVVGGADSIIEAGTVTARMLDANQETRQTDAGDPNRVLALVVWERGEGSRRAGSRAAVASVFVHDRGGGYDRIRAMRELIIKAVVCPDQPVLFVRGAVAVQVLHSGRTGFQRFDEFDVAFERVDFAAPLVAQMDSYT